MAFNFKIYEIFLIVESHITQRFTSKIKRLNQINRIIKTNNIITIRSIIAITSLGNIKIVNYNRTKAQASHNIN
jgi:hypothetical protein